MSLGLRSIAAPKWVEPLRAEASDIAIIAHDEGEAAVAASKPSTTGIGRVALMRPHA